MRIYLAGGIHRLSDNEAADWRTYVKTHGGNHVWVDPMSRDYRRKETGLESVIVAADLQDLASVDLVLANCEKASWGTAMELVYARVLAKPVWAIGLITSPWLVYHSERRYLTLTDAITDLVRNEVKP